MTFIFFIALLIISPFNQFPAFASKTTDENKLETYIVHVEAPDEQVFSQSDDLASWYNSFIPVTTTNANDDAHQTRIIHSYRNVFTGFAAKLSSDEVKQMENKPGFISAQLEKTLSLQTTHSPNFLGLNQNVGFRKKSNYGKGVIIGVLDTGITPVEHLSFTDEGVPPPPTKWKGKCDSIHSVCNNKIIGARSLFAEEQSPIDENGHGTHCASTAAGNFVKGANVYGNANGTSVGIAPLAHLAIYKICTSKGICLEGTTLAAVESAIGDGVDVLSISIGGSPLPFYQDNIAQATFRAMEKGIFISCAAGNSGPLTASVVNGAPWVLTVGASTIDRKIKATAVLGNNRKFYGESAFQPKNFTSTLLPLVYAGNCSLRLNKTQVEGKIVVCDNVEILGYSFGQAVKNAGGAGVILVNSANYANYTTSQVHVLPATCLSYADGLEIKSYINSTLTPTATIDFEGTIIGDSHAPVVAVFSARGPNNESPGILKPDIIGPGVDIVAAWPISVDDNTNTKSAFNFQSGTSMSCPHLSGVAALLKSAHPDWSPAAIKSAIMTTADVVNLAQNPIEDETSLPADLFATGAGHVNPSKANDPGLIYDIQPKDYVSYLCGLNYTNGQVGFLLHRRVNCLTVSSLLEAELNYPSFSLVFESGSTSQTYTRTVTNVGKAKSCYEVEIGAPSGTSVVVKPTTLNFSKKNQKLQYQVTFSRLESAGNCTFTQGYNFTHGFLKWVSIKHTVRSPIAVILYE